MISLVLPFAALVLLAPAQGPNPAEKPAPQTNDFIFLSDAQPSDSPTAHNDVCYKIRAYIFERNDGDAPKLVRETTCPPAHPKVNRAKAKLVPAN